MDDGPGNGDAVRPATLGQRIRAERGRQGLSLQQLATLSGLSKGFLSKVENGLSSLDERRTMHAVADALRVPVAKLTGQPYDPSRPRSPSSRGSRRTSNDMPSRACLIDTGIDVWFRTAWQVNASQP